jgi:hypothetical protein
MTYSANTMIHDLSGLLLFARNWYGRHSNKMIPIDNWQMRVRMAIKVMNNDPGGKQFRVSFGDRKVVISDAAIIPALAAISLSLTTAQVAKVLVHHQVNAEMVAQLAFPSTVMTIQDNKIFTPWNVYNQLIRAICEDRERGLQFATQIHYLGKTPELELACLCSPIETLWPSTRVKKHMLDVDSNAIKVIGTARPLRTILSVLVNARMELSEFSDDQIIEILDRSGNLVLGANQEYGFGIGFFKDFLLDARSNGTKNLKHILDVLNRIDKPSVLEVIRARIFEDLNEHDRWDEDSGFFALTSLYKYLSREKYGSIASSVVLKLNALPPRAKVNPLNDEKHLFLKGLFTELAPLKPEAFGLHHFNALGRAFAEWTCEQDTDGVDLGAMLIQVMRGWDAYQALQNDPGNGRTPEVFDVRAGEAISAFIKYAGARIRPDYAELNTLSPKAQAMLASNGYDIRQLKGISARDRGRLLEEGLGL